MSAADSQVEALGASVATLTSAVLRQGEELRAFEARLAEIEAARVAIRPRPEPLVEHNARRQADAQRLREAIRQTVAAHQGPERLRRKDVLHALEGMDFGGRLPSLSAIGWHLRAIRSGHQRQHSALTPE